MRRFPFQDTESILDISEKRITQMPQQLSGNVINASQSLEYIRKYHQQTDSDNGADTDSSTLCSRCATLKIDDLIKTASDKGPLEVLQLGSLPDTLALSPCALCRLFWATRPEDISDETQCYVLVSFPGSRSWMRHEMQNHGSRHLCVSKSPTRTHRSPYMDSFNISMDSREKGSVGLVYSRNPDLTQTFVPITKVPTVIHDYNFVREWVHECETLHIAKCSEASIDSTWPKALVLISCKDRQLVQAVTRVRYAALSYVWGKNSSGTIGYRVGQSLDAQLPRLIEDAIIVTQQCDIEFLWIDRYCIDQGNSVIKHDQIRQMDLVYSNAFLTIVDAAETIPEVGLRGVSFNARTPHPMAQLDDCLLATTLPDPKSLIRSSPWNQRGWTYQEGFFSRRRIVFTQSQVYWECQSCYRLEALPLFLGDQDYRLFRSSSKNSMDITAHIREYSRKNLSYDSDAINALTGLLTFFEETLEMRSLMGLPLLPYKSYKTADEVTNPRRVSQTVSFAAGLTWTPTKYCRRREAFPSWSWAGWTGEVLFGNHIEILGAKGTNFVRIDIEDSDGALTDADSYFSENSADRRNYRSIPFLHITAHVVPIKLERLAHDSECWTFSYKTSSGHIAVWENTERRLEIVICSLTCLYDDNDAHLRSGATDSTQRILGLVFGDADSDHNRFVLLVRENGSHFERFGHIVLHPARMRLIRKLEDGFDTPIRLTEIKTQEAREQYWKMFNEEGYWRLFYNSGCIRSVRLG